MKTILVRTKTQNEAQRMVWDLTKYKCNGKGIVQTSNVTVKFAPCSNTDGLRCDVPVGFGSHGKVMAAGHEYPKIDSLKDIVKYIVEEEKK